MGKTGSCSGLLGRAMLSKSLIKFSVDGQGCVPSLLFDLKLNYGGGNEDNGDLLLMVPCRHRHTHCSQSCISPPLTQASSRDSWALTGKSGLVSCGGHCSFHLGPGAWKILFVPSKSLFPQSCVSSVIKSHWPPKSNHLGVLSPFARSTGWENCCGP